MSLKYEILKRAVKLAGLKKAGEKSAEEIIAIKKKQNASNQIPELKDPEFEISTMDVNGFKVLKLIHKTGAHKANLFIIGGGMVSAPRPGSIRKALRFAKETGLDVFVPYYPLCTEYPVSKAYEIILETYARMLESYRANDISLLGTSSGGNLALGMIAYMNATHSELPRPNYILAISPGTCPVTEEEKARMVELDKKDVAISAGYMITAEEIMRHGSDDVPDYMLHLQNGDFTNCPKVTFIYGTDEVLYAIAPSFEAAMKQYGVNYELIVGEGLFHCYPVFPICKEGKDGWKQMIRLMKENA